MEEFKLNNEGRFRDEYEDDVPPEEEEEEDEIGTFLQNNLFVS